MKIVFLSDFHLGFSQQGRETEAFNNAMAAVKTAIKEKPDAIVFTGDLFHKDVPEQETLLEAFRVLSLPHSEKSKATVIEKETNLGKIEIECNGIPFIAIHGTHEFRGKDFANVLEVLESAGFIVYVHAAQATFRKHRETVVFHGLGGVPEKKARDALKQWDPLPEPTAFNILLLHQSLKEFLPFDDEMIATISITDLPKGFDLIVNGHLHWNSEFNEAGRHVIIPGSTVITQMKRLESKKKKGFYVLDTKKKSIVFREIPNQRPFYYKKIEFSGASVERVMTKVGGEINRLIAGTTGKQHPLIKLKLSGTLAKGFSASDLDFRSIEESFKGKAVVSIASDFREESFKKKIKELGRLQEQRKSISELGLEILEKNLEETDFKDAFDARRVFELLKKNEIEKALEIIASLESEKTERK